MPRMSDYLNSFYVVANKNDQDIITAKTPFFVRTQLGRQIPLYKLREVQSPLLQAIENNDVALVQECLKRDHISPNQQYVIPQWEISKTDKYYVEPLLHRAVWAGSVDVFQELLAQGADPHERGYANTDAIDNIFDPAHHNETKMLQMGKALIKFGQVSPKELKHVFLENRTPVHVRSALTHYAQKELKPIKIFVSPLVTKREKPSL